MGVHVNHTSVFSVDEEQKLWDSGVLSVDNPIGGLQRAVFFYVGKCFCIRGGEGQRKLGPSQFVRSSNPDVYTYIEHGSKNRYGGLNQLKLDNKEVPCHALPKESHLRCLVYLLDQYFEKLPLFAFERDVLYCRSKKFYKSCTNMVYEADAVGKNKTGKHGKGNVY